MITGIWAHWPHSFQSLPIKVWYALSPRTLTTVCFSLSFSSRNRAYCSVFCNFWHSPQSWSLILWCQYFHEEAVTSWRDVTPQDFIFCVVGVWGLKISITYSIHWPYIFHNVESLCGLHPFVHAHKGTYWGACGILMVSNLLLCYLFLLLQQFVRKIDVRIVAQ
jgi:hypothetical protein